MIEAINETVESINEIVKVEEEIVEVEEEIIERPYTLRKLKDGDLIPLLGLFRKLGLKDFKEVLMHVANGGDVREIGVNVFLDLADMMLERNV